VPTPLTQDQCCVIIGASHAGVSAAFALRKYGWIGEIYLFEKTSHLPYHRPPLSKTFLYEDQSQDDHYLKNNDSYKDQDIQLHLNTDIIKIDRHDKYILDSHSKKVTYDYLIYACGAKALVPPIVGINNSPNVFCVRELDDILAIKAKLKDVELPKIVIIGGGYIGLEIASSMRKMNAEVVLLERENRLLQRVSVVEVSDFFESLHVSHGVKVFKQKNVNAVESTGEGLNVKCDGGSNYQADIVILGVGIVRNVSLANEAGLVANNAIVVDDHCRTNDPSIFAIGDCTEHHNNRYSMDLRLESIQNANDQAKVAAANICGEQQSYDPIPWFWSDQYDTKLQTVGIYSGYTDIILRKEINNSNSISIWYFKNEKLLAVDAINHPKAYVLATKIIKKELIVNKEKCANPDVDFHPKNIIST